jgi:general stress protein 26
MQMDTDELLLIARETIDKVTYCFAATSSEDGEVHARIVQPRKLQDDWTVDFTTSRRCRKVEEIQSTGKLTLAYQHDAERGYVCLVGHATIIHDIELKRSRWSADADRWYPGGPDDPNVVIVRLATYRIELWNSAHNVMPEPKGLSAAVLVRDGSGWRRSAT